MYQNLASLPQSDQIPQPQQQQVTYGSPDQQKRVKFKNILHNLGITEVILGGISCLLCIATLIGASISQTRYFGPGLSYVSQGLWCGGFLIASGILGLRAKNNPSRCVYNANMALAIIASFFMGVLVIISSIAAIMSTTFVMICHILLALVGFAGMVLGIIHAAYCCAGVCCIGSHYMGPVVYGQQQASMQPMMQVQLANGQYMMVPYQPIMQPNIPTAQVPITAPVVSTQMPIAAATPNPNPSTALESHTKPPEYTAYPHQQI